MARKTKTLQVEIDDKEKEVVVKELSVAQIINIADDNDIFGDKEEDDEGKNDNIKKFAESIDSKLLPLCINIKLEDFKKMYPSDIKEVYNAFKEVNAVFFDLARQSGMTEVIENLKEEVIKSLQEEFLKLPVDLLNQDTQESSNTGTPT